MTNSTDLNKTLDSQIDSILLDLYNGKGFSKMFPEAPLSPNVEEAKERLLSLIQTVGEGVIPEKKVIEVEVPHLYQGVGGGSAPFYCSGCQMSETDIMENHDEDDGRYWCRCSFWDTPHNAFIDKSGGNWLGWKNKQAAQDYLNSLPIEENGYNQAIDEMQTNLNKIMEGGE